MNTNEANAVRLAIQKMKGNGTLRSHADYTVDVVYAQHTLEHLLDASQPDDPAAQLQARIDAALTDIADMVRGYGGAADSWWTSKLTRIARVLKGASIMNDGVVKAANDMRETLLKAHNIAQNATLHHGSRYISYATSCKEIVDLISDCLDRIGWPIPETKSDTDDIPF